MEKWRGNAVSTSIFWAMRGGSGGGGSPTAPPTGSGRKRLAGIQGRRKLDAPLLLTPAVKKLYDEFLEKPLNKSPSFCIQLSAEAFL